MRTRVLVVEDSRTVRARIVEVLRADPALEVVGEAGDGREGIELCQRLRPDVVTLDMMLPIMTGLAATEYIMAYCPTPILIVSSSTNRGELFRTYEALAAGAVDVLEKPRGDEPDGDWERRLVAAVKLVSRVRVITHPRARLSSYTGEHAGRGARAEGPDREGAAAGPRAVALGVSTGGPAALVEVLGHLPPSFPLPVLAVMHLGPLFSAAFADWLGGQCALPVRYARDGEVLPPVGAGGGVILAPPERHLVVRGERLHLTTEAEVHSCRPSVDVLFTSLARELGGRVAACLMTGMGRDGAAGLLEVRRAGGLTIAQDEASSVVFGMPREAIALGAARQILALREIGPTLERLGRTPDRGGPA